ncbi:response regulator transcription factor [Olsenella uli]|uniref:response regulator transcription factor n=1 Tax=Olsenella uli TaxID=133926 RepID=UPI00195EC93F|nr:response regulator transcription factor [Olsenella uli]MBM6676550.1 response regulator transcription factor [Olsenella uli]
MITDFNLEACRDSAVIYSSVLEQVKMVYDSDPTLAGELAIAAIQTVICGESKSDNGMVNAMLTPLKQASDKNYQRYKKTCDSKRAAKIKDLRLDEIAELKNEGKTTREIEEELGIPKSTVAYRIGIIEADYPELCPTCPTCPTYEYEYDYEYDNENDIETENVIESENEIENENENVVAFSDKPKTGVAFGNAPRVSKNYIY